MSDETWIFESLIGFLRGPVWNYPIQTFIEQRSTIFEPQVSKENDEEYHKTHEEYKNLVDLMLSSYMEDLNISTEQFDKAMETATSKIKKKLCHLIFEEVWAASNYDLFKKMMTQKNIELQLQALNLLREKYGVSLKPTKGTSKGNEAKMVNSEEEVMKKIREQSIREHKENADAIDKEMRDLEEALARSAEDHAQLSKKQEQHAKLLEDELQKTIASAPPESEDEIPCVNTTNIETEKEEAKEDAVKEAESEEESKILQQNELERRTEFLRMQRDKLLAMKKAERERLLSESENSANVRPKSSRAARRATSEAEAAIDPQTLSIRKALVEKLKKEVVNNN